MRPASEQPETYAETNADHCIAPLQAATRGDGLIGEDVTPNAAHIAGLPAFIANPVAPRFTVRGEVFISKRDFAAVNAAREAAGLDLFSTARNAAAGSLRLLDSNLVAQRRLSFAAFELLVPQPSEAAAEADHDDNSPAASSIDTPAVAGTGMRAAELKPVVGRVNGRESTAPAQSQQQQQQQSDCVSMPRLTGQWECLRTLDAMGFATVSDQSVRCAGVEHAISAAERFLESREELEYEVDGCVLKVDDLAVRVLVASTLLPAVARACRRWCSTNSRGEVQHY